MNILVITTEYGSEGGGVSLSCTRLVDMLSQRYHVQVSFSTKYPINTASGGYNLSLEEAIRKEYKLKEDVLKYKDIDVVIGFGGRYNGYYASLLAERLSVRFLLNFRGSDINMAKWSADDCWHTIEACRIADKIICLSQEMINNISSIAPNAKGKSVIIPNEIGIKTAPIHFPNLPQKVVIGCAASHLNEKKGIGNLLFMIAEFKRICGIPIILELIGDIDADLKASYNAIINEMSITDNVVFYNRVSRDRLSEAMSHWDFYIQASVCEGHPNAITEALGKGRGFISSITGFVAERLYQELPHLFFESFNPSIMAEGLKKLITTPSLDRYYEHAWNLLENQCNKKTIEKKWEELLSYSINTSNEIDTDNVLAIGLHDVYGDLHDSITTPESVFQQFVNFIHDQGYGLCSMSDYLKKTREERKRFIVCTFDDGYKSLLTIALPILAKYNYSATVYICTDLIGKDNTWNNKDARLRHHLNVEDMIELYKSGWEIASHGVTHRNLLKLSDTEIEYELSESKRILSAVVGNVITYAYPYGAYNNYIKTCVAKYYKYAFAVTQGGTSIAVDLLQLRRYSISDIYKMLLPEK